MLEQDKNAPSLVMPTDPEQNLEGKLESLPMRKGTSAAQGVSATDI